MSAIGSGAAEGYASFLIDWLQKSAGVRI